MTGTQDLRQGAPVREPAINVRWPVGLLVLALILAHVARVLSGGDIGTFALTSTDVTDGRWTALVTHLFVHGGWAHLAMNSVFILAFGAPVAGFLGTGWRGGMVFLAYFLVCGVIAGAAYTAMAEVLAAPKPWGLVGASGAASGLMGAAMRLIEGRGGLGPIVSRRIAGVTIAWIVVNLVLGVTGLTPGAAGVPVAWQAHVFGYLAGLLLIGPFGLLADARRHHANAL
jgi:membrane associated rhomboid family serine protease